MKTLTPRIAFLVAVVCAAPALAQQSGRNVGASAAAPAPKAYFSPRLGAHFHKDTVNVDYFGRTEVLRIASTPIAGSPLASLNLAAGDSITRLDNDRTTEFHFLESHVRSTDVRYIKNGSGEVKQGNVFIDAAKLFKAPREDKFSKRLGAYLQKRQHTFATFAPVMVYEVTSQPVPGSPLSQMGLKAGSLITRLNGISITTATDADALSGLVTVRHAKDGVTLADGKMFVHAAIDFSSPGGSSNSSNSSTNGSNALQP